MTALTKEDVDVAQPRGSQSVLGCRLVLTRCLGIWPLSERGGPVPSLLCAIFGRVPEQAGLNVH
jgi:hypothetical protein